MTDIKTLENILHREEMKKPIPNYGFEKSGAEYKKEWNKFIDEHIPNAKELKHNDWIKYRNITDAEYKTRFVLPALELERLDRLKAQLGRARLSIILGASYIYLCILALFGILIWA